MMADSNLNRKTKWLNITHQGSTGKTDFWNVYTLKEHALLGYIFWHPPFYGYSFSPSINVVCRFEYLRDIADFIEERMDIRKQVNEIYKKSIQ